MSDENVRLICESKYVEMPEANTHLRLRKILKHSVLHKNIIFDSSMKLPRSRQKKCIRKRILSNFNSHYDRANINADLIKENGFQIWYTCFFCVQITVSKWYFKQFSPSKRVVVDVLRIYLFTTVDILRKYRPSCQNPW